MTPPSKEYRIEIIVAGIAASAAIATAMISNLDKIFPKAQVSSGLESKQTEESVKVHINVLDLNREPLENVKVLFISAGPSTSKLTNSDGYVDIEIPKRDDITVILSKEGFKTEESSLNLLTDENKPKIFHLDELKVESVSPKSVSPEAEAPGEEINSFLDSEFDSEVEAPLTPQQLEQIDQAKQLIVFEDSRWDGNFSSRSEGNPLVVWFPKGDVGIRLQGTLDMVMGEATSSGWLKIKCAAGQTLRLTSISNEFYILVYAPDGSLLSELQNPSNRFLGEGHTTNLVLTGGVNGRQVDYKIELQNAEPTADLDFGMMCLNT